MELLRAENISHSFDYPLFNNINISIKSSTSIAILGTSGCGKSTLLHILSTLLKPKTGKVEYNKQSIYELKDDERLKILRQDFGIIFQAHYLFKGFSGIENIEFATLLNNQKLDYELLEKLKISHILKQKIGELSGGQQQRISIARVLSKKPKIIFADELTGNLDTTTAHETMKIIFEYIDTYGASLVFVTHDKSLAKMCDKTYNLENQNLIEWNS